jgi:acetoacetyl-CoA synthetase
MTQPLWTPSPERLASHALSRYAEHIAARHKVDFRYDYSALHRWSVEQPDAFWTSVIEFSQLLVEGETTPALVDGDRLPGARWYPNLRLNYAENLLRHPAQHTAVIACNESGQRRAYSFGELRHDTLAHMRALQAAGADANSTVAAILPNIYEAVPAMLGAAALGSTWCSVSPDFGTAGILDRLGQAAPTVLYVVRKYRHNGKDYDISGKLTAAIDALPSLKRVVLIDAPELDDGRRFLHDKAMTLEMFLGSASGPTPELQRFPFDHPLFILFTSGTTGAPKCIVHGAGGTLVQLIKEHTLHCNVGPGSRVLFPTTLGWMMWNWLVSSLTTGGTIILFDGSPAHPAPTTLFDVIEREQVTMVGLASAFIEGVRKGVMDLRTSHRFDAVDMIFAGGSVLSAEAFRFMSTHIMPGKPLYSCSGGTDIVSCFLASDPWSPIYAGELSAAALGMDMHVYDGTGRPVIGAKGELVCARPAPSMPRGFLNDAHGNRYRAAYFERFPNVWAHGDFAEKSQRGTFIIHGRSDTVLNPGGVRIGTAEIYRQVDRIPEIAASVAVGQQTDDDVRVMLFVKLAAGLVLDDALENRIRQTIREGASPRHVPKRIVQVPDIPVTRSGKISEAAVREVVNGQRVKNTEALLNPEALIHFQPPA